MKAYERVIKGFFTSEGAMFMAFIGFMVVIAVLETRSEEAEFDTEQIVWCLDNGGRTVEIDGITDCFRLTEVSGLYEETCTVDPSNVYIPSPGSGVLTCYRFKRLAR